MVNVVKDRAGAVPGGATHPKPLVTSGASGIQQAGSVSVDAYPDCLCRCWCGPENLVGYRFRCWGRRGGARAERAVGRAVAGSRLDTGADGHRVQPGHRRDTEWRGPGELQDRTLPREHVGGRNAPVGHCARYLVRGAVPSSEACDHAPGGRVGGFHLTGARSAGLARRPFDRAEECGERIGHGPASAAQGRGLLRGGIGPPGRDVVGGGNVPAAGGRGSRGETCRSGRRPDRSGTDSRVFAHGPAARWWPWTSGGRRVPASRGPWTSFAGSCTADEQSRRAMFSATAELAYVSGWIGLRQQRTRRGSPALQHCGETRGAGR
ncbi:hypothetical protein SHIRM173S_07930 [Streptomyces hirsutus]